MDDGLVATLRLLRRNQDQNMALVATAILELRQDQRQLAASLSKVPEIIARIGQVLSRAESPDGRPITASPTTVSLSAAPVDHTRQAIPLSPPAPGDPMDDELIRVVRYFSSLAPEEASELWSRTLALGATGTLSTSVKPETPSSAAPPQAAESPSSESSEEGDLASRSKVRRAVRRLQNRMSDVEALLSPAGTYRLDYLDADHVRLRPVSW